MRDARAGDVVRLGGSEFTVKDSDISKRIVRLVWEGRSEWRWLNAGALEFLGATAWREQPELPMGLGAVVELDGVHHVRVRPPHDLWPEWRGTNGLSLSDERLRVRGFTVLSEGWLEEEIVEAEE